MRIIAMFCTCVLLSLTPVLAGTTGVVKGVVTDLRTGAPVADAQVRIVSPVQIEEVRTDSRGHFVFMSLLPQRYAISVEKVGHYPQSDPGILVSADTVATQNVALFNCDLCMIRYNGINDNVRFGGRTTTLDMYHLNNRTVPSFGTSDSNVPYLRLVPGVYVPPN